MGPGTSRPSTVSEVGPGYAKWQSGSQGVYTCSEASVILPSWACSSIFRHGIKQDPKRSKPHPKPAGGILGVRSPWSVPSVISCVPAFTSSSETWFPMLIPYESSPVDRGVSISRFSGDSDHFWRRPPINTLGWSHMGSTESNNLLGTEMGSPKGS